MIVTLPGCNDFLVTGYGYISKGFLSLFLFLAMAVIPGNGINVFGSVEVKGIKYRLILSLSFLSFLLSWLLWGDFVIK